MNASLGKIGFIGIGAMGTPMAGNLAKAGYPLVIYDADPKRALALAAAHEVEIAENLAALGAACEIVITMLPDGAIVRKVLCGDNDSFRDCVGAGLKTESLVVDMSSSAPLGTRELGALLAKRGVNLIDAPVSNGMRGAVAGTLADLDPPGPSGQRDCADG